MSGLQFNIIVVRLVAASVVALFLKQKNQNSLQQLRPCILYFTFFVLRSSIYLLTI